MHRSIHEATLLSHALKTSPVEPCNNWPVMEMFQRGGMVLIRCSFLIQKGTIGQMRPTDEGESEWRIPSYCCVEEWQLDVATRVFFQSVEILVWLSQERPKLSSVVGRVINGCTPGYHIFGAKEKRRDHEGATHRAWVYFMTQNSPSQAHLGVHYLEMHLEPWGMGGRGCMVKISQGAGMTCGFLKSCHPNFQVSNSSIRWH